MSARRERYWVHSDPEPPTDVAQAGDNPPCPGRCNRAWRDPASIDPGGAHLDHDGQIVEPVPGQPIWCRPCADRTTTDLGQIPDLAAQVVVRRDGRLLAGTDTGDRTRKSSGTAAASQSPAFDVLDDLAAWAADLVVRLANDLGEARPLVEGTRQRVVHLSTHLRWIRARMTAVLAHDVFAVEWGQGIARWVTQLERASGQDRFRHRLLLPCPSCEVRALAREDGTEQVECGACGRTWSQAEYDFLGRVLADERRRAG